MLGVGKSAAGGLTEIGQRLLQNISFWGQQVRCVRVGNADIPNDKRLSIALQYIYGIGGHRAQQILADSSIENKFTRDLTGLELNTLREEVSKYLTGEDLKRRVSSDIQSLIDIRCYRGHRHVCNLPCRGQRTSTNARTAKEHKRRGKGNYEALAEWMQKRQARDLR